MARWGMTKCCPPWHLTPTKVAVVAIFGSLTLLATYSQTQLYVSINDVRWNLPQKDVSIENAVNGTIPWQQKDDHPAHVATDILRLEPPDYANDFQNPCWRVQRKRSLTICCLPYFFIAGMPKSGTTDLYNTIGHHRQVCLPLNKEPHWWVRTRYNKRVSMESYVKLFDKPARLIQKHYIKQDGKIFHPIITGDGSASTFWDNFMWRRIQQNGNTSFEPNVVHPHLIKHMLPNAKVIVIFRNPIDRLYSGYLYFSPKEQKSKDAFHDQCLSAISAWRTCVERYTPRYCVYNMMASASRVLVQIIVNMYAVHVREWLKVFPREQMYFIKLQEYSSNRAEVLKNVFKFLELDPFHDTDFINTLPIKNRRKVKDRRIGQMHNRNRQLLQHFFAPYNKELAHLIQDQKFLFA